jgi:hypothetical protein
MMDSNANKPMLPDEAVNTGALDARHDLKYDDDNKKNSIQMDDNASQGSNGSSVANIPEISLNLAWSTLSDSFFLVGGICYMTLSVWDIVEPEISAAWKKTLYGLFENAGPIVYLINSVIDVRWARNGQKMDKRKRQQQRQRVQSSNNPSEEQNKVKEKLLRVRKFAAHRRGLLAAATFGVAAFLAVLDEFVRDAGETNYNGTLVPGSDRGWLDFLSVNCYLLSAIFAVTGQRTKPRTCSLNFLNDPDLLEDLGDNFFLIGCLFDAFLCDFHFDDSQSQIWSAVSSLLWFLDACFYLRSDYCTAIVLNDLATGRHLDSNAGQPASFLGTYVNMESSGLMV